MTIKEELLILFLSSIPLAAYAAYIRTIDLDDRVSDVIKRVESLESKDGDSEDWMSDIIKRVESLKSKYGDSEDWESEDSDLCPCCGGC